MPDQENSILESSDGLKQIIELNPIKDIIQLLIGNNKIFAKYQQILVLYPQESGSVLKQFSLKLTTQSPNQLSQSDVECKAIFRRRLIYFGLKFIPEISKKIRHKHINGDGHKFEKHFLNCVKILLYHALTSKIDSANLALLELEQL